MKLSIIVPVYNVEPYIRQCIDSLLNQDCDDYEIIVVDDGCKDNSVRIVETCYKSPKLRIVHQENKGLSGARNFGLSNAKGEYVWFFDSDDWMDTNSLKSIVSMLNDVDALFFSSFFVERDLLTTVEQRSLSCSSGIELSKRDYYEPAQFYVYKRDFLQKNHLSFYEGIYHEDVLFTPCTLYQAGKLAEFSVPIYHLRRRLGSISQTVNPKRCFDLMRIIEFLDLFCKECVAEKDRVEWGNSVANQLNNLMYTSQGCDKKTQENVSMWIKKSKKWNDYLAKSRKIPTKILAYISILFHLNCYSLYNFFFKIRYAVSKPNY